MEEWIFLGPQSESREGGEARSLPTAHTALKGDWLNIDEVEILCKRGNKTLSIGEMMNEMHVQVILTEQGYV